MARLFGTGFEESAINSTMWTSNTGAPVVNGTNKYSGSLGLTTAGSGNSYVQKNFAVAPTTALYTKFMFNPLGSLPSALTYIERWLSSANVAADAIQLQTSGILLLLNEVAGTTQSGTVVLSPDNWYRIEHHTKISDTVGFNTVKLYNAAGTLLETIMLGTSNDTSGNQDTLPTNHTQFRLGKTASTTQFGYDDVEVNDESGSFQTSYPGSGKTYILIPNGTNGISWFNSADGVADNTYIDDLPGSPDDATTYNSTHWSGGDIGLGNYDRFALTNIDGTVPSNATIKLVDVYARVGSTQTANTRMQLKLWNNLSALTDGPSLNANVNGWKILGTNEHLVYDATGLVPGDLNGFNAGYGHITDVATLERRVTALWANVVWNEAAGQTISAATGSLTLTGLLATLRLNTKTYLRHRI